MKKNSKTTVSIYYSFYFGPYSGFHEWCCVTFYGAREKELGVKFETLLLEKQKEYLEKQKSEKALNIAKLKDEILVTPNVRTLFFRENKKLESLKEKLKQEQERKTYKLDEMQKRSLA